MRKLIKEMRFGCWFHSSIQPKILPRSLYGCKFQQSLGLPFQNLLPESEIQKVLDELKIKYRQRLFAPFVTLWAFLSQVLESDKSCHNVVSRVISYLVDEKVELPSTDSSAYCQARSRLPEELLEKLFGKAAQNLEAQVTMGGRA